jgi:hypothetical protein
MTGQARPGYKPGPSEAVVMELEREHPAWQCWRDRLLYCARRWDGTGRSLNGHTPDELSEYIAEAETEGPPHI